MKLHPWLSRALARILYSDRYNTHLRVWARCIRIECVRISMKFVKQIAYIDVCVLLKYISSHGVDVWRKSKLDIFRRDVFRGSGSIFFLFESHIFFRSSLHALQVAGNIVHALYTCIYNAWWTILSIPTIYFYGQRKIYKCEENILFSNIAQ